MTTLATLKPNVEKYNGLDSGNGAISKINAQDSNYNKWTDDDDNKRYESYLDDCPSDFYLMDRLQLLVRAASWSGGSSSSNATHTLFDGSSNQIAIIDNAVYNYQSYTDNGSDIIYTSYTPSVINGFWICAQALGIGKGYEFREDFERVSLFYYTTTEAAPTLTTDNWHECTGYYVAFTRALTSITQTIYLQYSIDSGAWTDYGNNTNVINGSVVKLSNGQTIKFRARCYYSTNNVYSEWSETSLRTITQPSTKQLTTTSKNTNLNTQRIEWNAGTCYNPVYKLERSYNGGGYSQVAYTSSAFFDDNLNEGLGTYTYRMKYNSDDNTNNYSSYSDTITITLIQKKANGKTISKVNSKEVIKVNGV